MGLFPSFAFTPAVQIKISPCYILWHCRMQLSYSNIFCAFFPRFTATIRFLRTSGAVHFLCFDLTTMHTEQTDKSTQANVVLHDPRRMEYDGYYEWGIQILPRHTTSEQPMFSLAQTKCHRIYSSICFICLFCSIFLHNTQKHIIIHPFIISADHSILFCIIPS